jgi:hypothetical protein
VEQARPGDCVVESLRTALRRLMELKQASEEEA